MKPLRTLMDAMLARWGKGPIAPVIEALDFFLFGPSTVPAGPPHVRDVIDVKRFMWWAIMGLVPPFLGAVYFFGPRVLLMVLVSYVAGAVVEVAFSILRREPIAEGLLVTGLIFPLTLPVETPLWMVAMGAMFGVFFGKEVFGGTGHNIMNPALVGRAFLFLSFPRAMSSGWVIPGEGALGGDATTGATPLLTAKLAHAAGGSASDAVRQAMGSDWCALLWTKGPDAIGATSAVLCLLGGIIVVVTRVANWRIPAAVVGTVMVVGGLLHAAAPQVFMPVPFQLIAGGLLYGAFFMATDPVSGPVYNDARWAYGVGIGLLVLVIRALSGFPEGVMFAILLMNLVAPLLDQGSRSMRARRWRRG
ncbi:MAG: RnfABCDGE type electron transport complex subunit D [Candidatus Eisenbacteria bacterium]|jgi:Na(+)-translocating NADH:ubiquinone oxidoreductase B subunit|nr:RnfABCDGE type electron transport complex subunit D [Candidatus Eisenbacteria bacterium]